MNPDTVFHQVSFGGVGGDSGDLAPPLCRQELEADYSCQLPEAEGGAAGEEHSGEHTWGRGAMARFCRWAVKTGGRSGVGTELLSRSPHPPFAEVGAATAF